MLEIGYVSPQNCSEVDPISHFRLTHEFDLCVHDGSNYCLELFLNL